MSDPKEEKGRPLTPQAYAYRQAFNKVVDAVADSPVGVTVKKAVFVAKAIDAFFKAREEIRKQENHKPLIAENTESSAAEARSHLEIGRPLETPPMEKSVALKTSERVT